MTMLYLISMLDQIPYVESGTYVAYNNENGGVIERLKEDGVVDLDSELRSVPEWISMKAMIGSWLAESLMYELWLGTDGRSARKIYYSDLAWPIGKVLFLQQVRTVKQQLGITKENAERREEGVVLFPGIFLHQLTFFSFSLSSCCIFLAMSHLTLKVLVLLCLFGYLCLISDRFTGKQTLHMELCQLN